MALHLSMEADSSRWPVLGKNSMACTPLVWPASFLVHFFGMKQACSPPSGFRALGGFIHERPW